MSRHGRTDLFLNSQKPLNMERLFFCIFLKINKAINFNKDSQLILYGSKFDLYRYL